MGTPIRRLHELHHERALMQSHNFNWVVRLSDWLYAPLKWQSEKLDPQAAGQDNRQSG
ncbi:hypothetical protein ACIGCM_02860 [Pseudomonas sp. NPDC078700]|uniref:hypothetical protein n=1 Tax=Pseudomonas sp. NPDC078700 TaxID=3364424 RepID=UPI0037CC5B3B